jgi:hypothetical protein
MKLKISLKSHQKTVEKLCSEKKTLEFFFRDYEKKP